MEPFAAILVLVLIAVAGFLSLIGMNGGKK